MTPEQAVARKMARLAAGGRPRVLDLFAGCGGLSLGFLAAGYGIAGAVEADPLAARSHGMNFHTGDRRHWLPRDITVSGPEDLARDLGLGPVPLAVDVIVGGWAASIRVGRSGASTAPSISSPTSTS